AAQPITVRAEHERGAFLLGDGSVVTIYVSGCSNWVLDGLHVESADNAAAGAAGNVVYLNGCDSMTLHRLLVARSNRVVRGYLMDVNGSSHVTVEECEGYLYHRAGVLAFQSPSTRVRRSYFNDRGYSYPDAGCFSGIDL